MTRRAPSREDGPFRVVVTDRTFADLEAERHALAGVDAVLEDVQTQDPGDLIPLVREADALLVQFARIDADVIEALSRCRAIVRYGIGVDTVDVEAATLRGIPVVNVPDYALDEVADHAMALLLALARKLVTVTRRVREGVWELSPERPMRSLAGRTLGLAGFGSIGRRVAARAGAFGMDVQAFDPFVGTETFERLGVREATWSDLLATSDVVSVHLPLNDATHHLFDDDAFGALRPGALLVNTSRGGVVSTEALLRALDEGRVVGAALDVLEEEPPPPNAPILHHPHAIVTSHCAWYTEESLKRLQRHAGEEVARALRGERPKHVVNAAGLALD